MLYPLSSYDLFFDFSSIHSFSDPLLFYFSYRSVIWLEVRWHTFGLGFSCKSWMCLLFALLSGVLQTCAYRNNHEGVCCTGDIYSGLFNLIPLQLITAVLNSLPITPCCWIFPYIFCLVWLFTCFSSVMIKWSDATNCNLITFRGTVIVNLESSRERQTYKIEQILCGMWNV